VPLAREQTRAALKKEVSSSKAEEGYLDHKLPDCPWGEGLR